MEQFNRQYKYNIQYNYGLEGPERDWDPHSCVKIISNIHKCSCPFKALNPVLLQSKLQSNNVSSQGIQEIMSSCTKGHYTLACTKYFGIIHKMCPEKGISSPNQYFDNSFEISYNSNNMNLDDNVRVREQSNVLNQSKFDINDWANDDFHTIVDQIENV